MSGRKRKAGPYEALANIDHSDSENVSFSEESESDSDFIPHEESETESDPDSGSNAFEEQDIPFLDDVSESDGTDSFDEGRMYKAKDGSVWSTSPPGTSKTPDRNILRTQLQKVQHADHIQTEVEMFQLYLKEDIIKLIVTFTNIYGRKYMSGKGNQKQWKDTDEQEIWALIGILITSGFLKQNMMSSRMIWSKQYGTPIIKATMSCNRFEQLMAALRFDDKETRSDRREKDKLAPVREVWDMFERTLSKHYSPGENLTVDEQLVPFRGRCSFIQYIPMKPDKYGIKLFWVVDSANYYPLKCRPYLGKEGRTVQVGLGRQVTLDLCRPFFGTNRNITADNFFTDRDLGVQLLSNGLTLVGTVRQNKRFLSPEFTAKKSIPLYGSLFGFQGKLTIVTYKCSKSKNVTLLSTMHQTDDVEDSTKKKPEIVTYYNRTKGGVDTMDEMLHGYTCKRRTRRWPVVFFLNMIDVAGLAAYIAWTVKFPAWKMSAKSRRLLFLQTVSEALLLPHMERRSQTSIPKQLQMDAATYLKAGPSSSAAPTSPVRRRRCCICSSKKDRKSKQVCSLCTRNVCKEHSSHRVVCKDCQ